MNIPQPSLKKLEETLAKQKAVVVREIRNKRELASLLKKGTHTPLSQEEWEAVRLELLDIAKTIPALAVFALPGGMVLLPLLFKVLPPAIRPNLFQADLESALKEDSSEG